MIKTTLAAATVALTLTGAGFALAQQTAPQGTHQAAPAPRFSAEDFAAMTDARIAGLKAGLKLTAEQEKNWPALETAIRDLSKQRADRMTQARERREARRSGANANAAAPAAPDAIARIREGANAMTARADSLKKLADAADPLYKSLDDSQKRRFGMLLRMGDMNMRGSGHHHRHSQRRADNR